MGLQIGQTSASLAALRQPRPREPEPARAAPEAQNSAPSARADFDVLSGPAAALVTIGRTVQGVREATPTLQETSVELRESIGERRVEIQRRAVEIGRRIETRIPEPSVQVQNFINQANNTGGQEILQVEGPNLEVGSERVPAERPEAEPRASVAPVQSASVDPVQSASVDPEPIASVNPEPRVSVDPVPRAPVDRERELPPGIDIRV